LYCFSQSLPILNSFILLSSSPNQTNLYLISYHHTFPLTAPYEEWPRHTATANSGFRVRSTFYCFILMWISTWTYHISPVQLLEILGLQTVRGTEVIPTAPRGRKAFH
jgi:hypothetical protein